MDYTKKLILKILRNGTLCQRTAVQMLIRIQFWELTNLFLKDYTYFLRSSPKEGMLRQTNISLALLYFGMPNSFLKLLLYVILRVFNTVLEQSYHNMEQYKLEQYDLNKKHFTSGEHLENFLMIILTLL